MPSGTVGANPTSLGPMYIHLHICLGTSETSCAYKCVGPENRARGLGHKSSVTVLFVDTGLWGGEDLGVSQDLLARLWLPGSKEVQPPAFSEGPAASEQPKVA